MLSSELANPWLITDKIKKIPAIPIITTVNEDYERDVILAFILYRLNR